MRIIWSNVKSCSAYVMCMPYVKLAPGLKRVRLSLSLDPKTIEKLREMSQEAGIPVSRVVDRLVLGGRVVQMDNPSKPSSGVDIDAVIAKLKANK